MQEDQTGWKRRSILNQLYVLTNKNTTNKETIVINGKFGCFLVLRHVEWDAALF